MISPPTQPAATLISDNIDICLPVSRTIDSVTEPPLSKGVKFSLAASNLDKLKGAGLFDVNNLAEAGGEICQLCIRVRQAGTLKL